MSDRKTEKKGILRFEEKTGTFIGYPENRGEGPDIVSEPCVKVYVGDEKVACIRANGEVIYGALGLDLNVRSVTLTREQRKEIDRKADEFQRKCDVEALVAACEEIMTLKQFPMMKNPPSEEPVSFADDGVAVQILKGTSHIGVMHSRGREFGKLVMFFPVIHTGLTEADRTAIVAKCREIVESYKSE